MAKLIRVSLLRLVRLVCLVCLVVFGFEASGLRADSPAAPRDYVQLSPGKKYELVLLPTSAFAQKDPNLRRRYRVSGLYQVGQPRRPLWTIDWYASQVFVSSDGHHLVRVGPWASSAQELALAFYRDGRLLRQYRIAQLVADPLSLPHSVSNLRWAKAFSFNDRLRKLRLTTLLGERYLFDITTGLFLEGREVTPAMPRNRAQALLQKGDVMGLARLGPEAFPELVPTLRTGTGMKQQMAFWALCANGENALEVISALAQEQNAATASWPPGRCSKSPPPGPVLCCSGC